MDLGAVVEWARQASDTTPWLHAEDAKHIEPFPGGLPISSAISSAIPSAIPSRYRSLGTGSVSTTSSDPYSYLGM